MESDPGNKFPDGFVWGAATAAYQIEGAVNEDGRGLSIWDTFAHTAGAIERGENADVACDFYHKWPQDLDLMSELGLQAFRFSVAWPRVIPDGLGKVNKKGLDFYDRLVDALLAKGITPYLTLYHWDLPQALQDQGGWNNRETGQAFARYAEVVARRLGDRVQHWITLNEPMIHTMAGHLLGMHAPGKSNIFKVIQVGVNLMAAHGQGVMALRSVLPASGKIGIALNLSPVHPAEDTDRDQEAARRVDLATNRIFLEPILSGQMPAELGDVFGFLKPRVNEQDLQLASQPIDFLGINYYTRNVMRHDALIPFINVNQVFPEGNEYSQMWEIYPTGLFDILERVWKEFVQPHQPQMRLLITENGVPVPDGVDLDERVRDERRIRYIQAHLEQVWRAVQAGVPVDGYLHWSLLDNFEWAHGYRMRFGLIYVDFETQKRIVKDSGRWFQQVIANNRL